MQKGGFLRRILVTGGAGYIGSHTCKLLKSEGLFPVVYDALVCGHAHAVKWGPLIVGDIADQKTLRAALEEHQIEAVIHFAAYVEVGESVRHPERYYQNNLSGTIALLEAMRQSSVG